MPLFFELTAVLLITTLVSFLMRLLKQPMVVGYIASGIIVGPIFLNILHSEDTVELFSKIGITILLFIVGLHLSPSVIKEVGKVSLAVGVGQVVFTSCIGFALALLLGLEKTAALYVAIALTFSSTIIVLKLLSDKGEVQTLYGRIAIGMLIVQDVIATIILIFVSSGGNTGAALLPSIGIVILKGIVLALATAIMMRWIIPVLLSQASKNQELLFVFSLSWGLGVAVLFQIIGLSTEIGALLAGVCLSSSSYAEEISSKLRPLRDFFIILFFVLLGAHVAVDSLSALWLPIVLLSVFVLIGNPFIVIIILNLLGYQRKTSFLTGLTVAQISEFSLILASLGYQVGHLTTEVLTIITMVGLITIGGSTYFILYSDWIFKRVGFILAFLELRKPSQNESGLMNQPDVLLFGYDRIGSHFAGTFKKLGYRLGVVDINPDIITFLKTSETSHFYGDAGNVEFLDSLPLDNCKMVLSSIPSTEINTLIMATLQRKKPPLTLVLFARSAEEALQLYELGAHYVVVPHHKAAEHTAEMLAELGFSKGALKLKRDSHKRMLKAIEDHRSTV